VRRGIAFVLVAFLVLTGWSIGSALTSPGTDSTQARLAEWARDHGMGRLVTWAENQQYRRNQPKVGGNVSNQDRSALAGGAKAGGAGLPAAIQPVVTPALPGEGVWKVLATAHGRPVALSAMVRPDASHTSYLASVAWLSGTGLAFSLHPGSQEPGGKWSEPDTVPAGQRTGLVATYNGGFRLKDSLAGSLGGYYADGRTAGQLLNGVAAEIFHKDGSMTIGMWGRDDGLSDPSVVAVRENLHLFVDNGQLQTSIRDGSSAEWGTRSATPTTSGARVSVRPRTETSCSRWAPPCRWRRSPSSCSAPARYERWSWTSTRPGCRS
jgi:hypothetical protein